MIVRYGAHELTLRIPVSRADARVVVAAFQERDRIMSDNAGKADVDDEAVAALAPAYRVLFEGDHAELLAVMQEGHCVAVALAGWKAAQQATERQIAEVLNVPLVASAD
jgi:hypothetical protein